MGFFCQQCGECCTQMGDVFHIREELGDLEFLIYNQYTGEEHTVRVDPDKTHLFLDYSISPDEPLSCPFLRRNVAGLSYCTVHETRPEICREYSCWRMLILDLHGKRAGRIMDLGHFSAEDPRLQEIWDEKIEDLDSSDRTAWERNVSAILSKEGYTVHV